MSCNVSLLSVSDVSNYDSFMFGLIVYDVVPLVFITIKCKDCVDRAEIDLNLLFSGIYNFVVCFFMYNYACHSFFMRSVVWYHQIVVDFFTLRGSFCCYDYL